VLQDAADPHRRRHVILRHAHALAAEIARLPDARAVADEHGRVAEGLGRIDRDGDERLAPAAENRVGRERQLGDVRLPEASHPVEDLLGRQREHVELDALRRHGAGLERERAIVIAHREGEVELAHAGRLLYASGRLRYHKESVPMRRLLAVGVALGLLTCATPAATQEPFYRGKTIRIIVGFTAGGGFDVYSRVLARHMARHIPGGPTIIVENMPGAGSLIAANYLYKIAKPDGLSM